MFKKTMILMSAITLLSPAALAAEMKFSQMNPRGLQCARMAAPAKIRESAAPAASEVEIKTGKSASSSGR